MSTVPEKNEGRPFVSSPSGTAQVLMKLGTVGGDGTRQTAEGWVWH
ncbi:hypothetical protein V6Z12_D11G323800 [Gossypium hirsutum]